MDPEAQELVYLGFRGRIGAVLYREDLDHILEQVHQAKEEGRISGAQEQDLEVLIDRRRQLPSRPPINSNTEEVINLAGINLPPSAPVLAHHAANVINNNSNFQVIGNNSSVAGGKRRRTRRAHRNRHSRSIIKRTKPHVGRRDKRRTMRQRQHKQRK